MQGFAKEAVVHRLILKVLLDSLPDWIQQSDGVCIPHRPQHEEHHEADCTANQGTRQTV
jgi:hypothetical protein